MPEADSGEVWLVSQLVFALVGCSMIVMDTCSYDAAAHQLAPASRLLEMGAYLHHCTTVDGGSVEFVYVVWQGINSVRLLLIFLCLFQADHCHVQCNKPMA